MDHVRRVSNRNFTLNSDRGQSSMPPADEAAPPTRQAAPTLSSSPPTESWTTHDSNLALFKCLSIATETRPALPAETILQILEDPTRWVTFHSIYHPPSPNPDSYFLRTSDKATGNPVLYTRSLSARDAKLLRKVVFTFRSRSQGWCSFPEGGNWSWFDASLAQLSEGDGLGSVQTNDAVVNAGLHQWRSPWMQRHSEELGNQPRYKIQSNSITEKQPTDYTVELGDEHELVQRVREGDRIILWACACFPLWENSVYEAKISLEGVDGLWMEGAQDSQ